MHDHEPMAQSPREYRNARLLARVLGALSGALAAVIAVLLWHAIGAALDRHADAQNTRDVAMERMYDRINAAKAWTQGER